MMKMKYEHMNNTVIQNQEVEREYSILCKIRKLHASTSAVEPGLFIS